MAPQRVILMSCGSYNPPTNMHLRMFEIARDHFHRMGTYEVLGGVVSPVSDAYIKKELIHSSDRLEMLKLALRSNDWIRISTWEIRQNVWTRTLASLTHHQNVLNSFLNNDCESPDDDENAWIPDCIKNKQVNDLVQIKLLCGADLLESFAVPNLWADEDIDRIVGEFGLVVVTREGSDPNKFVYDSDILSKHMHNIFVVTEWIPNEISSTRIRRALKRGESVKYLLQDAVIDYIYENEIYDAKPASKTKSDLPYNANDYSQDLNTPTQSSLSKVVAISTASLVVDDLSRCVLEMNLQNSSQDEPNLIDKEKSDVEKPIESSNSKQVPSEPEADDETSEVASSRVKVTDDSHQSDQHCLKTEPLNRNEEEQSEELSPAELEGKFMKSIVNSKSPKREKRRRHESRKSAYHSSSFRHRRYRDDNSDEDNTIVRSSIAKKPLILPRERLQSNGHPSIFLQGSLDSINIEPPKTGTGIRLFEINSKKSKSYESIKRSDRQRLSLVKKPEISQSDSTSKLITANDFDAPTEEFCSVCYLPNDPSSAEIFYTVPSNCSSPVDDDSTKCDICSWNLQADSDIPEQSVKDTTTTYETCEICGEPASSFDKPLVLEEKRTKSLSLNKLSLKLDLGDGVLEEENPENEFGEFDSKKIDRRHSRSLTEHTDMPSPILFVPKDEIAMGKSGKKFGRKGSLARKVSKTPEKRRYSSVDNLQYTKYSFKIPGNKLSEARESKYMASADNIRTFRQSRTFRRSADNIGKYDSSGDNLDSLDENADKDEETQEEGEKKKIKSDTIKMILTQHGIKIISGKETVL